MEENNENIFLEESTGDFLHIKDITVTILRNFHWFLLCAIAGATIAYFTTHQKQRIYSSNAKIAINNLVNENAIQAPTTQMSSLGSRRVQLNSTAINAEIFSLKSKTNMIEVVERLNLNVDYECSSKVLRRMQDLYGESPIDVKFLDFNGNQYLTLVVNAVNDSLLTVTQGELEPIAGKFGDTLTLAATRVVVDKTWFLTDSYFHKPITVHYRSVNDVADKYRYALDVVRNDEFDNVLLLSMNDTSPFKAADVINESISVYNDAAVNSKKGVIAETYDYINERLASLDTDLSSKENEIAAFKSANQIIDTRSIGQEYLQGNIEASDEMENLQRQLSLARYVRSETASNSGKTVLPTGIGLENSTVDGMIAKYNENAQKLDKYEKAGNLNNPVVKDLKTEQAAQQATITNMLDSYISSMEAKAGVVQDYSNQMSSKLRKAPTQQVYIQGVERLQQIKESLYLNLLSKREELLISQPSIEGNAKVIDEARVNRTPVAPDEKKQTLIGFLIGLLIPVALFFLINIFDTRVKFRDDIEKGTTIPFLGEIPANHLPGEKKKKNKKKKKGEVDPPQIVVSHKRRDPISEAFRILRSNIEYVKDPDKKTNVFLVTSLLENSGKTFLTSNLATSMAMIGKKVVIVDCDLRKCTTTKQFSSTHNPGMSEYLSGQVSEISSVITKDGISEGVDALFTGAMPPNPAELLSSERFSAIVEYLKKHYEYIFLDAIPAGILADTGIISKYADSTIFVVRSGKIDRRMLPDIEKIYKSGLFPKMSIVLNDVEYAKKTSYGHGYGYGYGQGYGYGYGHSYGYGDSSYYGSAEYEAENGESTVDGKKKKKDKKS